MMLNVGVVWNSCGCGMACATDVDCGTCALRCGCVNMCFEMWLCEHVL